MDKTGRKNMRGGKKPRGDGWIKNREKSRFEGEKSLRVLVFSFAGFRSFQ